MIITFQQMSYQSEIETFTFDHYYLFMGNIIVSHISIETSSRPGRYIFSGWYKYYLHSVSLLSIYQCIKQTHYLAPGQCGSIFKSIIFKLILKNSS